MHVHNKNFYIGIVSISKYFLYMHAVTITAALRIDKKTVIT